MDETRKTIALGLTLLLCLALASFENMLFFAYVTDLFSDPLLSVLVVFVHNVLVVSLILVAMTFYVNLVLTFFPKRKYEYVVLEHPRTFAVVFTIMILGISVLRTITLIQGTVFIDTLALVLLVSAPNGIVEGYGIFQCINKTLRRTMTAKDLAAIYLIFLVAAVVEIGYTQALMWVFRTKPF